MSQDFKQDRSYKEFLPNTEEELILSDHEAESLANELRTQMKEGVGPIANREFINKLIAGLGEKRGLLRRTFSKTLGNIGVKAIPALTKVLHNHSNVTVRRAAAKTLRLIKNPITLPHLYKALTSDIDPVVQGSCVAAMAIFGEESVELLLEVFNDPQSTAIQCGLASWGISFIGSRAPEAILKASRSESNQIRAAAIAALTDQIHVHGDNTARNIVLHALKDPSEDVRSEATILIGRLNEQEWSQPLLINQLNDICKEVRKNAAFALIKINATNSISSLENKIKEEKDQSVLKVFNLALNRLRNN